MNKNIFLFAYIIIINFSSSFTYALEENLSDPISQEKNIADISPAEDDIVHPDSSSTLSSSSSKKVVSLDKMKKMAFQMQLLMVELFKSYESNKASHSKTSKKMKRYLDNTLQDVNSLFLVKNSSYIIYFVSTALAIANTWDFSKKYSSISDAIKSTPPRQTIFSVLSVVLPVGGLINNFFTSPNKKDCELNINKIMKAKKNFENIFDKSWAPINEQFRQKK